MTKNSLFRRKSKIAADKFDLRNKKIVVSFCNQISSPDCSLIVLDLYNNTSRWIDFSCLSGSVFNGFSGVCGISAIGGDLIITTQGQLPLLAYINLESASVENYISLEKCKDPHSLVCFNDYVYIVSTGTNEIIRVPYQNGKLGEEEVFWSYPGVAGDSDEVHLNGLTMDDGKFIASCFGPRVEGGSWGKNGRIFYIDTGHSIHSELCQPHSPIVSTGRLVFAESAAEKVYLYDKTEGFKWHLNKVIEVNGYTRGLVVQGDCLLVGVSASRELSRSKGVFLYNKSLEDSALLLVDMAKGNIRSIYSIAAFGREVYDLVQIDAKSRLQSNSDSTDFRISRMESWVDRYTADINLRSMQISDYKKVSSELVSVIIPTYNRANFIEESIQSVLSQTYTDLEVIIVDDGSTDNTQDLVSSIDDPRLIYIRQPNRGRSNARNKALAYASGKYITFLDSDDIYLPDKIAMQVSYLNLHPGVGMVYTSAYCIDESGSRLEQKYIANESGFIYLKIAFFTPLTITLPTVMTYKGVIGVVGGFDEKLDRFEDTDMWRRISKNYRIDAMEEFTCLLRTHDDNSLKNQNPEKIIAALDYYGKKIIDEDSEFSINVRKNGLLLLYRYYANAFMTLPQFAAASRRLTRSSRVYRTSVGQVMFAVDYTKVIAHYLLYPIYVKLYPIYAKVKPMFKAK